MADQVTLGDVGSLLVSLVIPVAALLGMLAAIARWVVPRWRRAAAAEMNLQLAAALAPILAEVTRNAGSSMKDHIDRLSRQVAEMDRKLISAHNRLDNLQALPARVSELALRLDNHLMHQHYTSRTPPEAPA